MEWLLDEDEHAAELFREHFYSDRREFNNRTRSYYQDQAELYAYGINWVSVRNIVKEHGAVKAAEELVPIKRPRKSTSDTSDTKIVGNKKNMSTR